MNKSTFLLFTFLLLPALVSAQYQQVNDIPYTKSDDAYARECCKLDVYYPTELKNAPVMVWFHCGGIEAGNKHIDQYAPLTHIRPDAPPIIIISGDRELELYGRYEEQAYFWRMLKLVGHKDVSLYEMQGFNHGDMPHPPITS